MEIIPDFKLETYPLRDHLEPVGEDIFKCQGLRPRNRGREAVNFKVLAIIKTKKKIIIEGLSHPIHGKLF